MRKVKLYIAISLDGYIATPDGGLDWLTGFPNPEESDYGYEDFYDTVGVVVMGKNTYRSIKMMNIPWPYKNNKTYVISHNAEVTSPEDNMEFISHDFADKINEIKNTKGKDIWLVGGGILVSSFINEGLLDSITLTTIPRILGGGIPLFPTINGMTDWKAVNVKSFYNGVTETEYERV